MPVMWHALSGTNFQRLLQYASRGEATAEWIRSFPTARMQLGPSQRTARRTCAVQGACAR